MLSSRLPPHLDAETLHEPPLPPGCIDLSCGNPGACGLGPPASVLPPLHYAWDRPYVPDALGPPEARQALAAALAEMGQPAAAEDLVLCASTSEAFAFLFKLVAEPGGAVAVGRPGYPLVQHLAELEGLRPLTYTSQLHAGRWRIDLAGIDRALAAGARAVVVISPNNPTGAQVHPDDLAALAARCNAAGALAIFDEVFAPYGRGTAAAFSPLGAFARAVSLGGLSKAACLPQAKLSWIYLQGSRSFRDQAKAGLCWIADAALSVGGPVLAALPQICRAMPAIQARVRARVAANEAALRQLLDPQAVGLPGGALAEVVAAEAGWYALVQLQPGCFGRLPGAAAGDPFAEIGALEARANVRLQPAALFDLPLADCVVASLLLPTQRLQQGWMRATAIARATD